MSAVPAARVMHSLRDYLARETREEVRHEYHDGEILAMAGGSMSHSQICLNLGSELRTRLKGKSCQAFDSNLRVRIETTNRVVYPDLSVVCGTVERDPRDASNGTILNPRVVIEVISPTTERYDRTEKRDHYLKLPSLQAYVLVDQDRPRVEVFTRNPEGRWELDFATGLDASLKIEAIGVEIPLREIYDRVEFPPPKSPTGVD